MFRVLPARPLRRARPCSAWLAALASAVLLAGCSGSFSVGDLIPGSQPAAPAQSTASIGEGKVKVGLILPLSASGNAAVAAQSMRNAAEMALAEFNSPDIQLLVKDDGGSAPGAQQAAQQALDEGAEIILGPLFALTVGPVGQLARSRNIPVIAFSTDANVASRGVYLLSFLPETDVERIVGYAASQGKRSFAALIPDNAYGTVVEAAFKQAVGRRGGRIIAIERYPFDRAQMAGPGADRRPVGRAGGRDLHRFDGRHEGLAYLDYTTDAIAYHLVDRPSVLVLGAGSGSSVLQALYHRATRIDVVELDPNMLRLVGEDYAEYAGDIYSRPKLGPCGRGTRIRHLKQAQWDLVQLPLLDAFGAGAAGVHGLSETYIYTVEAFGFTFGVCAPAAGSASRRLNLPPRDALKLFATTLEALRRLGIETAEQRVVLLRGLNTTTLLVKNGVVTETEIAKAKAFSEERSFDLCYYPEINANEANRFNILDEPYFFMGAKALIGAEREAFVIRYKFDISPATDERPYFFDFLKWRTLPVLMAIRRAGGAGLLELGRVILVATLIQAMVLSAVLIMAPLWAKGGALVSSRQFWRVAAYFFALGLAFLFVEIAFIQKFILFLGHPLYAVAVVLTAFLLFAGVGSGVSSRFAEHIDAWHRARPGRGPQLSAIQLSIVGIVAMSVLYVLILPRVFDSLLYLTEGAKILVSLGLIAPLAFFMGMPFPLGLSRVWLGAQPLVPWAWGVNGCASVLSARLATLIAMTFGFSTVVLAAASSTRVQQQSFIGPLRLQENNKAMVVQLPAVPAKRLLRNARLNCTRMSA